MHKLFAVLFLTLITPAMLLAKEPALSIAVKVNPADDTYYVQGSDVIRTAEATATVRNMTQQPISISEYICNYLEDWKTDNKAVIIRSSVCTKNFPSPVILNPGQAHTVELPLVIKAKSEASDVHFKVAYNAYPATDKTFGRVPLEGSPFWSDKITVHLQAITRNK